MENGEKYEKSIKDEGNDVAKSGKCEGHSDPLSRTVILNDLDPDPGEHSQKITRIFGFLSQIFGLSNSAWQLIKNDKKG